MGKSRSPPLRASPYMARSSPVPVRPSVSPDLQQVSSCFLLHFLWAEFLPEKFCKDTFSTWWRPPHPLPPLCHSVIFFYGWDRREFFLVLYLSSCQGLWETWERHYQMIQHLLIVELHGWGPFVIVLLRHKVSKNWKRVLWSTCDPRAWMGVANRIGHAPPLWKVCWQDPMSSTGVTLEEKKVRLSHGKSVDWVLFYWYSLVTKAWPRWGTSIFPFVSWVLTRSDGLGSRDTAV